MSGMGTRGNEQESSFPPKRAKLGRPFSKVGSETQRHRVHGLPLVRLLNLLCVLCASVLIYDRLAREFGR